MAPGAFRHGLLHLHQGQNGGGDLVFPHGNDLIHILPAQLEGQIAGALDRNAVGNGSHTAQLHRTALPGMDCSMEAAPSAWTPMTRQEGLRCLMA